MRDAIKRAEANIASAHKTIRANQEFIYAAQKVCEHEWEDAPDLFCYHKRESKDRCRVCGLVG